MSHEGGKGCTLNSPSNRVSEIHEVYGTGTNIVAVRTSQKYLVFHYSYGRYVLRYNLKIVRRDIQVFTGRGVLEYTTDLFFLKRA